MKWFSYFFLSLLAISLLSACSKLNIEHFKVLGTDRFDQQRWSTGDEIARGKMLYDFLVSNSPILGKDRDFIIEQLGPNTGYYLYDSFPAYYLGPKPKEGPAKAWLVAFVLNHETNKVREIYVHPDFK